MDPTLPEPGEWDVVLTAWERELWLPLSDATENDAPIVGVVHHSAAVGETREPHASIGDVDGAGITVDHFARVIEWFVPNGGHAAPNDPLARVRYRRPTTEELGTTV